MSDCPFCDKIANGGDEHGPVVYESKTVRSFAPLNPVTEGHRLFVPIFHAPRAESNVSVTGAVFTQAARCARWAGYAAYNLIQSNGAAATQSVPHMHVHLVPRRDGDGLALPWSGGAQ